MTTSGGAVLVPLSVLGVRVDVAITGADQEAITQMRNTWRQCIAVDTAASVRIDVALGDDPWWLSALSREVTRAAIDARSGKLLMLHAGCIANPTSGRALAVVGPSGAGKSTWVTTYGRNRRYLSDETLAVHADGRIESLAKPISLVAGDHKEEISPGTVGLLPALGNETLAGLWLLDRHQDHGEARLEQVDLLDALVLLSEHASHLAATERPLHLLAAVLVGCGGLHRVHYRDVNDLADLVDTVLGQA